MSFFTWIIETSLNHSFILLVQGNERPCSIVKSGFAASFSFGVCSRSYHFLPALQYYCQPAARVAAFLFEPIDRGNV